MAFRNYFPGNTHRLTVLIWSKFGEIVETLRQHASAISCDLTAIKHNFQKKNCDIFPVFFLKQISWVLVSTCIEYPRLNIKILTCTPENPSFTLNLGLSGTKLHGRVNITIEIC